MRELILIIIVLLSHIIKGNELVEGYKVQRVHLNVLALESAKKYSIKYDVPLKYILRVMKHETGYRIDDTLYNPYKKEMVSSSGALGPMQILPSTARSVWRDTLIVNIKYKLQYDIDFSIHSSVKFIAILYNKYHNWLRVFSVYNLGMRGEHEINRYARGICKE